VNRLDSLHDDRRAPVWGLALFLAAAPASAATITINSTGDAAANDGQCTLREAIGAANSDTASGATAGECAAGASGLDAISFAIPGSGVRTIVVTSPFPVIHGPISIDGFTQAGSSPNSNGPGLPDNSVHRIEIDGSGCTGSFVSALLLFAEGSGGSTVRGLVINRCGTNAIRLANSGGGNHIEGNFLGTSPDGMTAHGNGGGVAFQDEGSGEANDVIGGATPGARNVISGNGTGIYFINASSGHAIRGNFIGTNAAGDGALGNGGNGIHFAFNTGPVTIGGTTAAERNIISGNGGRGIAIGNGFPSGVNGVVIEGNFIGTDRTGSTAIPNGSDGITVFQGATTIGGSAAAAENLISGNNGAGIAMGTGPVVVKGNKIGVNAAGGPLGNQSIGIVSFGSGATIGGTAAGEGNLIAYNGAAVPNGAGILLDGGTRTEVEIRGNSIFSNTSNGASGSRGLGIDLNNDGPTANDPGDGDGGDDKSQNYPVITAMTPGASVTIQGTLNSASNATYHLDFFASPSCDPTGFGEGKTFLGTSDVTTNGSGDATFSVILSAAVTQGQVVTATATDSTGNTSEFSACFPPASNYYTLPPCRVIDTRRAAGSLGGPALAAGATRSFTVAGECGIPADAKALSINVTVTLPSAGGDLRLFSTGTPLPLVSAINYGKAQTRANNAVVRLSDTGAFSVRCDQTAGTTVHFVADVNGYFK
jgi:CSLREA domain-containing protein